VDFEWDDAKNRANQEKHGVSFDDARELFESEELRFEFFDGRYPPGEDRFKAVGPVGARMMLVVFSEPKEDLVRIISARPATRREIELYVEYRERMFPHG